MPIVKIGSLDVSHPQSMPTIRTVVLLYCMNLAIIMLIIYVILHTVLLVLLYRDQTLFGNVYT
jgi:hypothetical protein